MYKQNLHTHGLLCDGRDAYEDTVRHAIDIGFDSIGFSGHSVMHYAPEHGMSDVGTEEYKREIYRLKEKYRDIIDVYYGIELDMFSRDSLKGYEYVIGSVHYLACEGEYVGFDRGVDEVERVIREYFGGDGLRFAKKYYETVAELPNVAKIDIVGHFDILTKNIEIRKLIDTESKAYRAYAIEAARELARRVGVFEVNTGAIARGYRTSPYPADFILREIRDCGAGVVISSDCHDKRYLNYKFDEVEELLRACGYREVLTFNGTGFTSQKI